MLADFGAIEYHGLDSDQTEIPNLAAMKHRLVSNRYAGTEAKGATQVCMKHCSVLNIAIFANMDQFIVATNHSTEPHATTLIKLDVTDYARTGRNPALGMGIDTVALKAIFHTSLLSGIVWSRYTLIIWLQLAATAPASLM
ncbi:hypothetical protein A3K88_22150 [Pseudomonas putida]|nr:hypothetical protein A3K88_22150 [Pseudomonas putida]